MPADSPDIIVVDGWFPVGLRLGPDTCLVRDGETPDDGVRRTLVADLAAAGLHEIDVAEDLQAAILAITFQRVDVIAATWTVWSRDEPTARAVISAAAA